MHRVLIGLGVFLAIVGIVSADLLALNVPLDRRQRKDWPLMEMELPLRPAPPQCAPGASKDTEPGGRAPFQYDVTPVDDEQNREADDSHPDVLEIRGA
jgi:hypothetical protein